MSVKNNLQRVEGFLVLILGCNFFANKSNLYGRGFTIYCNLQNIDVDRSDIENKIRNQFFDMKLNPIYEAVTYGWTNMDNKMLYPGFHKTKEEHDGYIFSSLDKDLETAHQFGKLRRVTLHRGTVAECITLEYLILKSNDAIKNPKFYNKSVGGGVGLDKTFSVLTPEMIKIAKDWVNGIEPVWEIAKSKVDKEDCKKVKRQIESGFYQKILQDVQYILSLPKNQVREEVYDPKHVQEIKEEMLNNVTRAREIVNPIIVIVHEDGSLEIIDGNHTIRAASEAGWTKIKVIYINASDFNYKQCNIDWFGYYMNQVDEKKKGNTDGDCKKAIARFSVSHPEYDISSQDFKDAFCDAYNDFWSNQKIAKSIKSVIDNLATQKAMADHNFKLYSDAELSAIVAEEESKDPEMGVISISASSCYNSGVGAIINKMRQVGKKIGKRCVKGMIVVSCRSFEDYQKKSEYKEALEENLSGYVLNDVNIKIKWLKEFVKTK